MISLFRTMRTALRALRRNVLRSALTTLGIIIGVAAVIAMEEIGQGSSTAVQKTIKSMGAGDVASEAELLVSELAANAVLHAGTPIRIFARSQPSAELAKRLAAAPPEIIAALG